jgi:hypothetical protein
MTATAAAQQQAKANWAKRQAPSAKRQAEATAEASSQQPAASS